MRFEFVKVCEGVYSSGISVAPSPMAMFLGVFILANVSCFILVCLGSSGPERTQIYLMNLRAHLKKIKKAIIKQKEFFNGKISSIKSFTNSKKKPKSDKPANNL